MLDQTLCRVLRRSVFTKGVEVYQHESTHVCFSNVLFLFEVHERGLPSFFGAPEVLFDV